MLKYLQRIYDRLNNQKTGMTNNAGDWTTQPENATSKDTQMQAIVVADAAVTAAEVVLRQRQQAARIAGSTARTQADETDNRVKGIYAGDETRWAEYGTPTPADHQNRPVPAQAVIKSVKDDVDGEGFIIEVENDPNGDFIEIEIGSAPATTMALAPPFPVVRTTKKQVYTDNNTVAGTRYFYRARWVNNTGHGEWSEVAVSRVQ